MINKANGNNLKYYFNNPQEYIKSYEKLFNQLNYCEITKFFSSVEANVSDDFLKIFIAVLIGDYRDITKASILCLTYLRSEIIIKQKKYNLPKDVAHQEAFALIDKEIELLRTKYDEPKYKNINNEFVKFIKKHDKLYYFSFLDESTEKTIKNLENQPNFELGSTGISMFTPILFSYIVNTKEIINSNFYDSINPEKRSDAKKQKYRLDRINAFIWSCTLVASLNYCNGNMEILNKAHLRLSYDIFKEFINLNNGFNITALEPLLKPLPHRNTAVPHYDKFILAKKLQCLKHGYVIFDCYYLDDPNLPIKCFDKLIDECPYRYDNKELPNGPKCKKLSPDRLCEFFNSRNAWLSDYELKGINLTLKDLIYLLGSEISESTMKKYILGKSIKISEDNLDELVSKTGIPESFFISSGFVNRDGFRKIYYHDKLFVLIDKSEILLLKKKYGKSLKGLPEDINKTDQKIIKQLFNIFEKNEELNSIRTFKKVYDKIEKLIGKNI